MYDARTRYVPSYLVNGTRLPILLFGSMAASVLVGLALAILFVSGWYLIIIVPCVCGLLLAASNIGLVAISHCRNPWIAGVTAALSGFTAFLLYFYFALAISIQSLPNPVVLPDYIAFRMNSDVQVEVGKGNNGNAAQPTSIMNWIMFCIELVGFTCGPGAAAYVRAKRVYVESLQQWAKRDVVLIFVGSGAQLIHALELGILDKTVPHVGVGGQAQNSASIILEYAQPPQGKSPLEYPIYVTINDPSITRSIWHRMFATNDWYQVALRPDEIIDLLPLFGDLKQSLGSMHREIQEIIDEQVESQAAIAKASVPEHVLATSTPVEELYRSKLHDKYYKWIVNAIGLSPLLGLFGGVGLLLLGAVLFTEGGNPVPIWRIVLGVLSIAIGGIGLIAGLYLGIYGLCVLENRWIDRKFRSLLAMRPGAQDWANDRSAIPVCIIPREHWQKVRMTMSSDTLLLRFDYAKRTIHMIGDIDNYTIPVESILERDIELFYHPIDAQRSNQLWMVRLNVAFATGIREILLGITHTSLRPNTNATRQRRAMRFCEAIDALREGEIRSVSLWLGK